MKINTRKIRYSQSIGQAAQNNKYYVEVKQQSASSIDPRCKCSNHTMMET